MPSKIWKGAVKRPEDKLVSDRTSFKNIESLLNDASEGEKINYSSDILAIRSDKKIIKEIKLLFSDNFDYRILYKDHKNYLMENNSYFLDKGIKFDFFDKPSKFLLNRPRYIRERVLDYVRNFCPKCNVRKSITHIDDSSKSSVGIFIKYLHDHVFRKTDEYSLFYGTKAGSSFFIFLGEKNDAKIVHDLWKTLGKHPLTRGYKKI